MTVCYLDLDDEITNAVSRVRAADEAFVTLVLPPGSRIATSRINFLILAREARARGRTLAVVSGEAGVRALAVSAGLPAYPTVEDSERALGDLEPPAGTAGAGTATDQPPGDRGRAVAGAFGAPPASGGGAGERARDRGARERPAVPTDTLWSAGLETTALSGSTPAATRAEPAVGEPSSDSGPEATRETSSGGAGLRKAMAHPIEPAATADIDGSGPASTSGIAVARTPAATAPAGSRETRAPVPPPEPSPPPHDVTWRDEPWRDPRGRQVDTVPASVVPVVEARSVAPHSAAIDAGSTAGGSQTSARARAVEERARRRATARRRASLLVRLGVVVAVLVILAGGLYLFLPTADITIRPRTQTAGPVTLDVVADPAIRVVDEARARIPADKPTIPLSVSDEFPATGTAVSQTRASGSVRFTSENTLFDVPVPAGTRVSTSRGITFSTRREVIIPKASFATGPTERDVDVQAVAVGPSGNVPAGAVTRVPESLSQSLVSVTNPAATSGGRRTESKEVQKRDYDNAVRRLTARLDEALTTALQDPSTTPQGLTVYPETATVEDVRPDQPAGDLVGTRATSFTLTLSATGKVLAVDRSLVERLAVDRLTGSIPQGFRLLDGTTETSIDEPQVEDDTIRYTVVARALQWRPVEPSTIITAVRGRRVQEAKTTLEQFGSASVRHWPEFLDTMPSQDFRITVQVLDPAAP